MTEGDLPDTRVRSLSESSGGECFDEFKDVKWQWEHRTGWRDYKKHEITRIERAYRRGDAKVRLKAGKTGTVPMVIFFWDMIQFDPITAHTRKVRRNGPHNVWLRVERETKSIMKSIETGKPRKEKFHQFDRRRMAIRQEFQKREYDVTELYSKTGWAARIARSPKFFMAAMTIVLANSIYIAVETDRNDAPTLGQSDWQFQVAEHTFCILFVAELMIRFLAFENKRDCCEDGWFRFDSILVSLSVLDTWVLPLVMAIADSNGSGGLGNLSVLRLARLLRLSRMTRLLRCVPEVLTLIKGIAAAVRSVFFTMLLLLCVVYVFGILFKTQAPICTTMGQPGEAFSSVGRSMWTLLLHGTFLDAVSDVLELVRTDCGTFLTFAFLVFIFLSSFTVLNMLIGILCEVVSGVSRAEKEDAEVAFLKRHLLEHLECYDKDDDQRIGKREFKLFMQNPDVHEALTKFGTDIGGLVSMADILFEDKRAAMKQKLQTGAGSGPLIGNLDSDNSDAYLTFAEFLEVVLRLRGGHGARVLDIVELREYVRKSVEGVANQVTELKCELVGEASAHRSPTGQFSQDGDCSMEVGRFPSITSPPPDTLPGSPRLPGTPEPAAEPAAEPSAPAAKVEVDPSQPTREPTVELRQAATVDSPGGRGALERTQTPPEISQAAGESNVPRGRRPGTPSITALERRLEELVNGQAELLRRLGTLRRDTITVHLSMPGGETRKRLHAASAPVGEMLGQLASEYGPVTAVTESGLELGTELTLGEALGEAEGPLRLQIQELGMEA